MRRDVLFFAFACLALSACQPALTLTPVPADVCPFR